MFELNREKALWVAILVSFLIHLPLFLWIIHHRRPKGGLEKVRAVQEVLSLEISLHSGSSASQTIHGSVSHGLSHSFVPSRGSSCSSDYDVLSKSSDFSSSEISAAFSSLSVSSVYSGANSSFSSSPTNVFPKSRFRFLNGERIVFDIEARVDELNFIKGTVGEVVITVLDHASIGNRLVTHCRAVAKTLDAVDSLYHLEDVFDTWFDSRTFEVLRYSKSVNEGGWRDAITNELNGKIGKGRHFSKTFPDGKDFNFPPKSYDMITLLYLIRAVRKDVPLKVNLIADEGQITPLVLEYLPEDDLKVLTSQGMKKVRIVPLVDARTGIRIDLAKYYHYFPVRAIIPAFHTAGYTFTLLARFRSYRPRDKKEH